MSRRALTAAACAFGLALHPASVGAYSYRGAKWPRAEMPVGYSIHTALAVNLPDDAVVAAIRKGFEAWGLPECAWAESRYSGRTEDFDFGRDDGRNVVSWRFSQWPETKDAIAVTSTITGFAQDIRDSDMIFNDIHFDFDTQGAGGRMDVMAIATHEAGHFFGLGHSGSTAATMYPSTGPGNLDPRTLDDDDIDGICELYSVENLPGVSQGERCGQGCEGGLVCLDDATAAGEPYCTSPCEFRDDCPPGYFCVGEVDEGLCRRYPEADAPGADLGDACTSEDLGAACQIGLSCVQDGGVSYCSGRCGTFAGGAERSALVQTDCPPGWRCAERRGGVWACLVDPNPPAADPAAAGEGEGEGEGEERAAPDAEAPGPGAVEDNSLCATAVASPRQFWRRLAAVAARR